MEGRLHKEKGSEVGWGEVFSGSSFERKGNANLGGNGKGEGLQRGKVPKGTQTLEQGRLSNWTHDGEEPRLNILRELLQNKRQNPSWGIKLSFKGTRAKGGAIHNKEKKKGDRQLREKRGESIFGKRLHRRGKIISISGWKGGGKRSNGEGGRGCCGWVLGGRGRKEDTIKRGRKGEGAKKTKLRHSGEGTGQASERDKNKGQDQQEGREGEKGAEAVPAATVGNNCLD